MKNLKYVLSVGLAAATLAVVMTYALGAQAILQSPYAEPGHELFMSMYMPLMQGMQVILGEGLQSQQMHADSPDSDSQNQGIQSGIIGNNILGSPAGIAAGGLAAVVVYSIVLLAAATFVGSWKQRSFVVAGLLAASGIILMTLPLANMNFAFPGPIIGLVVGLVILGLGITKGVKRARGNRMARLELE